MEQTKADIDYFLTKPERRRMLKSAKNYNVVGHIEVAVNSCDATSK
jgi:hypothetical protein